MTAKKRILILCMTLLLLFATGCSKAPLNEEAVIETYEPQPVPDFYKHDAAIAYQIFPIAFADGSGNGIGDIEGIISKLDYLKDELHVDVLWLTPVHPSPSYHKYDVTNYFDIDLGFGTLESYKRLIEEAHKRDMRILLDFVINHTSSSHPWFISAKSDPDSQYRDYYVWDNPTSETHVSTKGWYSVPGGDEMYFASFWSEMPELNFDNPKVRSEIKDIAKYWLDLGVDGFRIDAAKHVYDINEYPKGTPVLTKNLEWFIEFNHYIKTVKEDAFLLLETWDNYNSVAHFLNGSDSAFNFDMGTAIISSVVSENRKSVQNTLTRIHNAYDKITLDYVDSVFLANHDQDRVMSQLGGDVDKAKLAATIQFTLPGLSWIYYGEEIGMLGSKPDEDIREGFKWTSDQASAPNSRWRQWKHNLDTDALDMQMRDETSMFEHYKGLTQLKATNDVIKKGSYLDYSIGTSFRLFAFYRQYEGETYLVIHNLHGQGKALTLEDEDATLVFATQESTLQDGRISLNPYGSIVIHVKDTTVSVEEIDN